MSTEGCGVDTPGRSFEVIGDVDALCRQIVDQSVDCIKVLDHEANVLWINDAGRKLMDVCDLSSMIGSRWLDFWTG